MFNRYWGKGTAVGLTLGICLSVLFFVWVSYLSSEVGCGQYDHCSNVAVSPAEKQENANLPDWWHAPYVTRRDTLAQWIMAVLSFVAIVVSAAAVIYVKRSLDATNLALGEAKEANSIAREIGQAQVMAYVYADSTEIDAITDKIYIIFKNFGNSPGSVSFVDFTLMVSDPYSGEPKWSQRLWSDGFTLAPQAVDKRQFRLDRGRGRYLSEMVDQDGIHVCVRGGFQSLDVFKNVHSHGINLILSDGVRA